MHESLLEKDFIFLADFDPFVATIEEQPVKIEWRGSKGRMRCYTPDFLVTFKASGDNNLTLPPGRQRPWLVEVKNGKSLKEGWEDWRAVFTAATRYAKGKGWNFHIRNERRLKTPFLENAKLLLPLVRLQLDQSACDLLLRNLRQGGPLTVDKLAAVALGNGFSCRNTLMTALWSLVARRAIEADLNRPLCMGTPLWIKDSAAKLVTCL